MSKNKFIIIAAPSGSGKSSIVNMLLNDNNLKLNFSTSATTRHKRVNEVDGKNYYFFSKEKFKEKIKNNEFVEWEEVYKDTFYGTLINELENTTKNIVFDIYWQGTRQIRNKNLNYKLLTIFILPPSKNELMKRLIKREKKNMKTVKRRMKEFKKDLTRWKEYDYVVINDNLGICFKKIMNIIKSKNKVSFNRNFIENHVKKLLH